MPKWLFYLKRITRRMWFRASLYAVLGVATALAAMIAKNWLPAGVAGKIGADSLGNVLAILAASMLTVTVFSLSTMVSAYAAASSSATPRATQLLIQDARAQGLLATFIGAFLYSIVGLIALSAGVYGDGGRLILFGSTIAVIVVITVTLLRAIDQFSRFGRMAETIDLVEAATRQAMQARADDPLLGCAACEQLPAGMHPVTTRQVGYIEHIDMDALAKAAAERGLNVWIECLPGTFVTPDRPLLRTDRLLEDDATLALRAAFSIGGARTIDSDPRYGLVVLTEIALRAMSPAINDPGTCIDVIGTSVRLLCNWAHKRQHCEPTEIRFPCLRLVPLRESDMLDDIYPLIAREGAASLEIGIRLQKAFAAIAATGYAPCVLAARKHADLSLQRALAALDFEPDRVILLKLARQLNLASSTSAAA